MKVLLCERQLAGHRGKYLERIAAIPGVDFYCYAPENLGFPEGRFFAFDAALLTRKVGDYLKWIARIRRIVKENGIDIVHILDGDSIMRYFGLGFGTFGGTKLVVTYHHFFSGFARKLSYCGMLAPKGAVAVVHTQSVRDSLLKNGIRSVKLCEYPAFDFYRISQKDAAKAREYWKLPAGLPVIGMVGGMNAYKNIPRFLSALQGCRQDFRLLICGKPGEVGEGDIRKYIAGFEDKVTLHARRLSEEEYDLAIAASDIIYCIYDHSFDGASGPLTDGVCAGKMILSCDHGSLGHIVRTNHLGFSAEAEDEAQILQRTEEALKALSGFSYDETAAEYRDSLKPEKFLEKYRGIYEGC